MAAVGVGGGHRRRVVLRETRYGPNRQIARAYTAHRGDYARADLAERCAPVPPRDVKWFAVQSGEASVRPALEAQEPAVSFGYQPRKP